MTSSIQPSADAPAQPVPEKPPSPTGTKRKRAEHPKFYAVQTGSRPGVYHSWSECLKQVKGYRGASFKSFSTLTEAEAFVKHGLSASRKLSSGQHDKFYAVRNGRVPGVYTDWPSAQKQILGFPKPKQKSFTTRAEADAFMRGGDSSEQPGSAKAKKQRKIANGAPAPDIDEVDESVEPGTGPMPRGSEDGFDPRIKLNPSTGSVEYKSEEERRATKMVPSGQAPDEPLRIYTDGSALNNGTFGAIAGVGVYFGPQDRRNVSEALAGDRQTNQRAELTAIKRAIDIAPRDRNVTIFTDSKYSIDCVTSWFITWRNNGWQTSNGKPVENRDLIETIINKIDERFRLRVKTEFQWLKGHNEDLGNTAADQLAVKGAREARAASGAVD